MWAFSPTAMIFSSHLQQGQQVPWIYPFEWYTSSVTDFEQSHHPLHHIRAVLILQRSCVIVFSLYVINYCQSPAPIYSRTENAWEDSGVFLISSMQECRLVHSKSVHPFSKTALQDRSKSILCINGIEKRPWPGFIQCLTHKRAHTRAHTNTHRERCMFLGCLIFIIVSHATFLIWCKIRNQFLIRICRYFYITLLEQKN